MRDRRVDPVELRRRIDALRVEREWPVGQVISYLGISATFYHYLRQGKRQPDLLTAHRLAARLGCTVEDFTVLINTDDGGNAPE